MISMLFSAAMDAQNDTVKPVIRGHQKRRPKLGFQDRLSLNLGQKYCRMLQILLTYIKLPFVIKMGFLSIFEWPLKTGFTVVLIAFHTLILRALVLSSRRRENTSEASARD